MLLKKYFSIVLTISAILLTGCNTNTITLKGKIDKNKKVFITNASSDYAFNENTIFLVSDAKGIINYSSDSLKEGYYKINGNNIWYLRPGFDIEFKEENKRLIVTSQKFQDVLIRPNYFSKEVNIINQCRKTSFNEHCKKVDNFFSEYFNNLKDIDDSRFAQIEKQHLDMACLMLKLEHRLFYTKDYKYQQDYLKLFNTLKFDNATYTMFPEWKKWLISYFQMVKYNDNLSNEEKDDLEYQLKHIVSNEIKKAWAWERVSNLPAYDDAQYKNLKVAEAIIKNEKKLNFIAESLKKVEKCRKGKPAFNFSYKDKNGKWVSLADLKGNYVYIDCWGIRCPACFMEMPHLRSIEEKFHNKKIKFVSLCLGTNTEKWKELIKNFKIGGINLISGKNRDISNFYNIKYIPRFILIDKEGKIVSSSALRPSNKNLETLLNKLLN